MSFLGNLVKTWLASEIYPDIIDRFRNSWIIKLFGLGHFCLFVDQRYWVYKMTKTRNLLNLVNSWIYTFRMLFILDFKIPVKPFQKRSVKI